MITFETHSRDEVLTEGIQAAANELAPEGEQVLRDLPPWLDWLHGWFPLAVAAPFAARHVRLWEWIESLVPKVKPRARVEIWGRGGAKSSTAELGVVRVGERGSRRFALYVSGTQSQANKHVQSIASRFETLGRGRAVNGYGNSLGWRMDLLRVEGGFNVLALGLDSASRGVKLGDFRPDFIIFDDVDGRHDSPETVKKKVESITDTILPSGSPDAAVLFIQNRMHSGSIATQLAEGTADFLLNREVFEDPAVEGLEYQSEIQHDGTRRYRITGGTPTWEGQNLATCEEQINEWGLGSFLREAQHKTDFGENGLWERARDLDPFRIRRNQIPELLRIVVGVDPSATTGGDEAGVIAAGVAMVEGRLHGYVLEDASIQGSPRTWAEAAVATYKAHEADKLVAEQNNGGEMVRVTIQTVEGAPAVKLIHASRGKRTRAEPVQSLYEEGRVHHVGRLPELETEMCNWKAGEDSPNRMDALVWAITELMLAPPASPFVFAA